MTAAPVFQTGRARRCAVTTRCAKSTVSLPGRSQGVGAACSAAPGAELGGGKGRPTLSCPPWWWTASRATSARSAQLLSPRLLLGNVRARPLEGCRFVSSSRTKSSQRRESTVGRAFEAGLRRGWWPTKSHCSSDTYRRQSARSLRPRLTAGAPRPPFRAAAASQTDRQPLAPSFAPFGSH